MLETVEFTAALDNVQGKGGQIILKVGYSGRDALRQLVGMCGQQVDVTITGKQEVIAVDGETGEVLDGQTSIYDEAEEVAEDAGMPDDFEGAVVTIDDYPIAPIDADGVRTTETVYHDVPVPPRGELPAPVAAIEPDYVDVGGEESYDATGLEDGE